VRVPESLSPQLKLSKREAYNTPHLSPTLRTRGCICPPSIHLHGTMLSPNIEQPLIHVLNANNRRTECQFGCFRRRVVNMMLGDWEMAYCRLEAAFLRYLKFSKWSVSDIRYFKTRTLHCTKTSGSLHPVTWVHIPEKISRNLYLTLRKEKRLITPCCFSTLYRATASSGPGRSQY
jgi:hypothetical protein